MATVLLCTDEPVLAEGLKVILSEWEGSPLRCCKSRIEDISLELGLNEPDLLLVDLTSDITFSMLKSLYGVARQTKIVLWVHTISTELALQAMNLGIRGIIRKSLPVDTLLRCMRRVQEGELWFEKTLTDSLMSARRYSLTRREGQLVALLCQGLKNKEIATTLAISEGTVKVYLSRLFQKLGVKDRFELALYGLKNLAPGAETGRKPVAPTWQAPRSFFVERVPLKSEQPEQRRPVNQLTY
jgi:DNA-binding NarL/FixJ family response regulator